MSLRGAFQAGSAFVVRRLMWPLVELKNGSVRLRELGLLRARQWDPAPVRARRQLEALQRQIQYCHESVPYYRKSWPGKPAVDSLADLGRLPVMDKPTLRAHMPELVAKDFTRESLIQAKTGGSTGVSLQVLFDQACEDRRNGAALLRNEWAGWEAGGYAGALWGNPVLPQNLYEGVRAWVNERLVYLDTAKLSEDSAAQFLRELASRGVENLFGHAHSLFLLATIGRSRAIAPPPMRAIVSTSMVLLDNERTAIEGYFGCKVTDRYGCEEVGLIASECEAHEGMHINDDHLVVEILRADGEPVEDDESGQIVVTDLINRGAPLVRYAVGDMTRWRKGACPCGRRSPRISRVEGRQADFLKRRDGVLVAGVSLVERTLTAISAIQQLQLVQPEIDRIIARVVLADPAAGDEAAQKLTAALQDAFVNAVSVNIEFVEKLEQVGRGKYRFAICQC